MKLIYFLNKISEDSFYWKVPLKMSDDTFIDFDESFSEALLIDEESSSLCFTEEILEIIDNEYTELYSWLNEFFEHNQIVSLLSNIKKMIKKET